MSNPDRHDASPSVEGPTEDPGAPLMIELVVEVARFGFAKRKGDGRIDFISPLPSPFNYGSVPGSLAPDGDELDVVLLGLRRPRGARLRSTVYGYVDFMDAGDADPKLVASDRAPTAAELAQVRRFFSAYARAKRVLNRLRGLRGRTALVGLHLPADRRVLQEWLSR